MIPLSLTFPGLLLVACALGCPAVAQMLPAETLLKSSRPLVIAHRGYSALAPENTLAAFDRALLAGADLVELDYHHSQDGVPVVIHDATLDRTTDAVARWGGKDLPVSARPARELLGLEAGSWFSPSFPAERVPTLEAALNFIQPRGVTLIERKAGDAATLQGMLASRGLVNRVVVQSFDWAYLRAYRALDPVQVLGALGPPSSRDGRKLTDEEKRLNAAWLREVRDLGAQLVVWNRLVGSEAVEIAHAQGLRVWVYTINEETEASSLFAMGVDGIITDNPAMAWKALAVTPRRATGR